MDSGRARQAVSFCLLLIIVVSGSSPAVELLTSEERNFESSTTPGRWAAFTWGSTEFSGNFPALIDGGDEFVSGNPVSIDISPGAPSGWGGNSVRIFWDGKVPNALHSHVGGVRITVPTVPGEAYTFSAWVRANRDEGWWAYGAGMSVDAYGGTDPRQCTYGHKSAEQELAPDLGQNVGDNFWSETNVYNNEMVWFSPSQFRCSVVAESTSMTLYLWGLAKWQGATDVRFDGMSIDGPLFVGPTPTSTNTPSPTATPTNTFTPTNTPTATATPAPGSLPITSVSQSASQVGLYQPFTVTFDLGYSYANPYDPREVDVSFEFTGPSAVTRWIPAFWNGTTSRWEARIVPLEIGAHTCRIVASDSAGRYGVSTLNFTSVPSSEKGFIRRDPENAYHLRFDNGEPYHPIGHNVDWVVGMPDHWNFINRMAAVGENWTRFWMVSYVDSDIEWGWAVEPEFRGLGTYSPGQSNDFDTSLDQCRTLGVYVQMCLDSFTGWNTALYDNWDESPYNAANGGPCVIPIDFLRDTDPKRLAKQRYRYVVARWAAHTNILCWELFNEIDALGAGSPWEDTYHSNRALGAQWHQEMAQYINSIDPFDHLVTTSFAHAPEQWAEVWNLPEIDLIQPHRYDISVPRAHADLIVFCRPYGKPIIMGEGGMQSSPPVKPGIVPLPPSKFTSTLAIDDRDGAHLHMMLWTGAVHESGIMPWWWAQWIDTYNLYYRWQPVVSFMQGEDWSDLHMEPIQYSIVSPHSNVEVYGSAGANGAMLWVKNWNSSSISGLRVRLYQVTADQVNAEFWNTDTGTPYHSQDFWRSGGNMDITFPTIVWDTAAKVRAVGLSVEAWQSY